MQKTTHHHLNQAQVIQNNQFFDRRKHVGMINQYNTDIQSY